VRKHQEFKGRNTVGSPGASSTVNGRQNEAATPQPDTASVRTRVDWGCMCR